MSQLVCQWSIADGSDEVGCGLYIYLNVPVTMGAAALALALLYFLDLGIELYLKTRTVSISALQTFNLVVLRLPHLEDLARNFPQILSEATFEMILFNDDHCYFFHGCCCFSHGSHCLSCYAYYCLISP